MKKFILIACLVISTASISVAQTTVSTVADVALFPVIKGGKWGYINKTGSIIVEPEYDLAFDLYEGMAAVSKDGKFGFINASGKLVIPLQFDDADQFSEGLAKVFTAATSKYGFIDKTGKMVIDTAYDDAMRFSNGLAAVKQGEMYGYIDNSGKMVIAPQYNDPPGQFKEGYAFVYVDGKYGGIDKTGKMVIPATFDQATSFNEGVAVVVVGDKWGYTDHTGKIIIPAKFNYCSDFSETRATAIDALGKLVFIDHKGTAVITVPGQAKLSNVYPITEGLAMIKQVDDKVGYVNKSGLTVVKAQFSAGESFRGGLARVKVMNKVAYIDKTGKFIWPATN